MEIELEIDEIKPTSSEVRLFQAIEEKDVERVKSLIDSEDCDVTYQDHKTGVSPLMIAAGVGCKEIVQILLQEGAPWNAVDRQYKCAGDYAYMNRHQDCIDALLHHATISEMLLGRAILNEKRTLNSNYLSKDVSYTGDKLMDSEGLAVMMDWEKDLMEKHAAFICHSDNQIVTDSDDFEPSCKSQRKSVRVLNVGFGMGIVDTAIQSHCPTEHYIIEAHPTVYEHLMSSGWADKPGVKILFGRWQDVVETLNVSFDGIFFDTYAEDDQDLRDFHEHLPSLLTPHTGRYSFYNGMCPDNVFFHAVACEVTRLELNHIGLSCEYESVKVDVADPEIWKGVKTRYWYFDTYYLPKCLFKPSI